MPKLRKRIVIASLVCISGCVGSGQIRRPSEKATQRVADSQTKAELETNAKSDRLSLENHSVTESADRVHTVSSANAPTQREDSAQIEATSFAEPSVVTRAVPVDGLHAVENRQAFLEMGEENTVQLNLPSVLAMIDHRHPVVGFARWRVQEAYAELAQAKAIWLPSIQAGFSFHRHDGNYQASNGQIVDVNRNSFQYGLGAGATGAGTTPRPGIVAQFHLADAIFQPRAAQKTAWARGHAAGAVLNQQLLEAGLAYFDLVDAHQDLRIVEQSLDRVEDLAKLTVDFAEAGEGLQADADRLRTELTLTEGRLIAAQERVAVASARLAQALSIDPGSTIAPMDVSAVPIEMVTIGDAKGTLISTALATRPELKESQALVAAACEAYRREKLAPFVPSMLLGFSTGGFGGGLGNSLANVDDRYDFDALMAWQVRNLGLGERAARRQRSSQVQQAKFEKLRVMDQVAAQVSQAQTQVMYRRRQLEVTRGAISAASDSFRRNLERIRDGQGLPIEVLQSVQALEQAQRAYLRSVIAYNQAQLQFQWALGWPVAASY